MRRVEHKWGHEEIIVETDNYSYELIHLKKGWTNACHYHNEKQETFIPKVGTVLLNVKGSEFILTEPFTVNPFTSHSFHALTDAVVIEVSTKHIDTDVVKCHEAYYCE